MIPNPGSDEAVEKGCLCPVIDNHFGVGNGEVTIDGERKTVFVFNEGCPLHGSGNWREEEESDAS